MRSGTYQTVGKASNNSRLIQNTFILANNTFKFDQPFNYPQAIQPPPLIERAHPIFIDLSNQNQYGINNNIDGTLKSTTVDIYQMRPHTLEDIKGKFLNSIGIYINQYGYDNIDKFKEDYESITFNFNLNLNSIWKTSYNQPTYTNSKSWFTPIKINLSDIGNLPDDQNNTALFQDNDNTYNNNSGNHNDSNNNWIFNINNLNSEIKQIASLKNKERLNNIYINDLLWTNDTPSSGISLPTSTWFKIMAFKTKAYESQEDNLIVIEYQFISTFDGISSAVSGAFRNVNWNLQTTSLVINPKSST
ncbi:hypothetical protein [Spiroplasma endosymbiont of Cleonymus obscurus]|uniref:hypothetical protein n=1 Tax=Spiroplasma endosymbiont of Cleonymus obscurus TaxID=3066324 RepID=UPI0037DD7706